MTILAADSSVQRLDCLEALLRSEFPSAAIVAESDSLAAGQYAFNHPVDILFAALQMPRINGLKLMAFVRHANPGALVFLCAGPGDDFETALWTDEVDGVLHYPIDRIPLRDALQSARRRRSGQNSR